eukprot:gene16265-22153_t
MESTDISKIEKYKALESRHKIEVIELDDRIRTLLKTVKKSNRVEVEAQTIRLRYDLKEKHQEEIDELESELGISTLDLNDIVDINKVVESNKSSTISSALSSSVVSKKAKAKRKQDKRIEKENELKTQKEHLTNTAGPSLREVELESINKQLFLLELQVKPVLSDGNCLYRAISDQLNFYNKMKSSTDLVDFRELRIVASNFIKDNPDDFTPFLGFEVASSEFQVYCQKVESSTLAEWGGELEIRALACALKRKILVYSSDSPVLCMDGCDANDLINDQPLRITFHRHYFALGEHYNSTIPLVSGDSS